MKTIIALASAAATLATGTAMAQTSDASARTGMYGSLGGGLASLDDVDVRYTSGSGSTADSLDFSLDADNAAAFVGAIGYDFGLIRADIEIATSKNNVNSFTLRSVNGQPVTLTSSDRAAVCSAFADGPCGGSGNTFEIDDAHVKQEIALANLWVDLPVGGVVTPYLGGGAGLAHSSFNDEDKSRFVWQAGAGVAVAVSRSISLTADYRHRQVAATTFEEDGESVRVGKLKTNLFTAGLRFHF
jgi:opacity protein-like surface antigen